MTINAQDLIKHQWKHRIVLIISQTLGNSTFDEQNKIFNPNEKEFNDRKLVVYQVLPDIYRLKKESKNPWKASTKLYQTYNAEKSVFKVVLIGLDGTIKHETSEILTVSELFQIIDAMPMRQSEIKNRD